MWKRRVNFLCNNSTNRIGLSMSIAEYSTKFTVDEEPVSKRGFVKFICDMPEMQELSWFTTDSKSFEWTEINQDKSAFIKAIQKLHFGRAYMGIFNKKSLETEYKAFKILGR